jgi:hypothetical protein
LAGQLVGRLAQVAVGTAIDGKKKGPDNETKLYQASIELLME